MATVTKGGTLPDSSNKTDFYALVDNATVTSIANADIAAGASIVDTKLATISTAGKVNTSSLVTNSQAAGDVIYNDGTNWVRLAKDAGKFLKSGASAVSWASAQEVLPAGSILQVVYSETGAVASNNTSIPFDDTIPQNTEGYEYMTKAITPTSSTNILKIDVVFLGAKASGNAVAAALFQDTTANALAVGMSSPLSAANEEINIKFTHFMVSGTTSATTFKVRAGASATDTVTFNGVGGGRLFGGVLASSITITEIKV